MEKLSHLKVKKLDPNAITPSRTHSTDAGLDLYALEDTFVELGSTVLIKTGINIPVPENYVGKIEDRSGVALKGLRTGGGVVDHGYTGDYGVIIHNLTNATCTHVGKQGYKVKRGDRIAQVLFYRVETPILVEVSNTYESERGNKGFNSSGR